MKSCTKWWYHTDSHVWLQSGFYLSEYWPPYPKRHQKELDADEISRGLIVKVTNNKSINQTPDLDEEILFVLHTINNCTKIHCSDLKAMNPVKGYYTVISCMTDCLWGMLASSEADRDVTISGDCFQTDLSWLIEDNPLVMAEIWWMHVHKLILPDTGNKGVFFESGYSADEFIIDEEEGAWIRFTWRCQSDVISVNVIHKPLKCLRGFPV